MKYIIKNKKAYEVKVLRSLKNNNLLVVVIGCGREEVKPEDLVEISFDSSDYKDFYYEAVSAYNEALYNGEASEGDCPSDEQLHLEYVQYLVDRNTDDLGVEGEDWSFADYMNHKPDRFTGYNLF